MRAIGIVFGVFAGAVFGAQGPEIKVEKVEARMASTQLLVTAWYSCRDLDLETNSVWMEIANHDQFAPSSIIKRLSINAEHVECPGRVTAAVDSTMVKKAAKDGFFTRLSVEPKAQISDAIPFQVR